MPDPALVREALVHARFKIEWAKYHVNGVEALVNGIIAENASVVSVQNDFEPGIARVTIGPKQRLPAGLPLHAGDAIHALNSVWDFLWSGLARSIDPTLASKITAPRHKTRKNLKADIDDPKGRQAAIHQAFPQAEAFVLDVVKPYSPAEGGTIVWTISKLDNINKHRLLIFTTCIISFDRDLVFRGSDGAIISQTTTAALQTQGYPLVLGLASPVQFNDDAKATVSIVFGEPDYLGSEPVVETLVQFVNATTELCDLFEKTFL